MARIVEIGCGFRQYRIEEQQLELELDSANTPAEEDRRLSRLILWHAIA